MLIFVTWGIMNENQGSVNLSRKAQLGIKKAQRNQRIQKQGKRYIVKIKINYCIYRYLNIIKIQSDNLCGVQNESEKGL